MIREAELHWHKQQKGLFSCNDMRSNEMKRTEGNMKVQYVGRI